MKKHIANNSVSDKISAMTKAKKTTDEKIDALAIIVGKGFVELKSDLMQEMDRRFGAVHSEMNQRFDAVDKRFDDVEKRLDRVEFFVSGYDRRLDNVEDKVKQLAVKVGLRFN